MFRTEIRLFRRKAIIEPVHACCSATDEKKSAGMETVHFAFDENSAWARCLSYFIAAAKGHSGSRETERIYRLQITRFLSTSAGSGPPKLPEHYTREDVEWFLALPVESRRNNGGIASAATRNQKLAVLNAFYKFAAQFTVSGPDGKPVPLFVGLPPTTGIKRAKANKRRYAFSFEEMERLFAQIPDTPEGKLHRALFLCYFWTAKRRSEILRLTWGDLFEGIVMEDGVARHAWFYRYTGKGKGGEEQIAELPAPAMTAIRAYLEACGRWGKMTPDSPLFVAVYRNGQHLHVSKRAITPKPVTEALKRYATAAGLDAEKISLHIWRHTASTARFDAGEDLRAIQDVLDHASLATTADYIESFRGKGADTGVKRLKKYEKFSGG